jgi:isochorismate synthase
VNIFDKFEHHLSKKLPFVVYRKPNSEYLVGFFQSDDFLYHVQDFTETGFVFSSFDGNQNILIPESKSEIIVEDFRFETAAKSDTLFFETSTVAKDFHIKLIEKGVEAIKNNAFQKVVLARQQTIEVPNVDLIATFKAILNQYKSAFAYCFYHPKIGLWMGAFSEQLLKVSHDTFSTASLAGTQKINKIENIIWQEKEINEQRIVTNYIAEKLKNASFDFEISEPKTIISGNLAHIKSEIIGVWKKNSSLKSVIEILHPTPAVCGYPTAMAKEFIIENEGFNRSFYAGFLGELNKDFKTNNSQTDLFVNLRCVSIKENTITFYAGGGITIDSIPEKEFQETENKIDAMRNCIVQKKLL